MAKWNSRRMVRSYLEASQRLLESRLRWVSSSLQVQDILVYTNQDHVLGFSEESREVALLKDKKDNWYIAFCPEDILEDTLMVLDVRTK